MLIGIDASRANKLLKTGVEWYSWHLIQELKKLTLNDNQNSWILYTDNILKGGLEELPKSWYEVRAHWPLKKGWTQIRLSWELWRRPTDLFFIPAHVLPRYIPKKSVVTVHDVGFKRYPNLYRARDRRFHEWSTKDIARRADRIITVSKFSAIEISRLYNIDPQKIAITYNGVDHNLYRPIKDQDEIEDALRRYTISQPFFVVIGRLEFKKNIINIVKAFNLFKARRGVGDPMKLVFIGSQGYGYSEIKKEILKSNVKNDIIQLGYVPEVDLPRILNGATALIHASWYEGFGIPPVMAMASGCPVLSSDSSSLPEIIGKEAGLFFPPSQIEPLANLMEKISTDKELVKKLTIAGIHESSKYTWRNTAKTTLPVLTQW